MRLKTRDLVATVLVAAVVVPYIGYLIWGEMPFLEDPRGLSALGLILGVPAYLILTRGDTYKDRVDRGELALAVVSLALGIATLVFAETTAAEVLLAVFMVSIVAVWAVEMTDHAGYLPGHQPAG